MGGEIEAIVRLDSLEANLKAVRSRIGSGDRLCLSIKADAYGHGAVETARFLEERNSIDALGIARLSEAEQLRKAGVTVPLLFYGEPFDISLKTLCELGVTPMTGSPSTIRRWLEEGYAPPEPLAVHILYDSGMRRLGCDREAGREILRLVQKKNALLRITGAATHFASSDLRTPDGDAFTRRQSEEFRNFLQEVQKSVPPGDEPLLAHAENSGALFGGRDIMESIRKDGFRCMARPGLAAYGYGGADLKPVMELRAPVMMVKKIKKNDTVSYGRTWNAPRDTRIAVIAAGYGDGVPRFLSNCGEVLIRGRRYPIVGRVCMDLTMAEIGSEPAGDMIEPGDAACFMGGFDQSGTTDAESEPLDAGIDAEEIAALGGTISYEILTSVSARVKRIYKS